MADPSDDGSTRLLRDGKLDEWERRVREEFQIDLRALWCESLAKGSLELNDWYAWGAAARAHLENRRYVAAISVAYMATGSVRWQEESRTARQKGDRAMHQVIVSCAMAMRAGWADDDLRHHLHMAAVGATADDRERLAKIEKYLNLGAEDGPAAGATAVNEGQAAPRQCPTCTGHGPEAGYLTCPVCAGKMLFIVGTSYVQCGACVGRGKIMCTTCHGTGRVD